MNLPPTYSIPTHNAVKEPSQKIKPRTHTRIIPSYQHISCNGGITKKKEEHRRDLPGLIRPECQYVCRFCRWSSVAMGKQFLADM